MSRTSENESSQRSYIASIASSSRSGKSLRKKRIFSAASVLRLAESEWAKFIRDLSASCLYKILNEHLSRGKMCMHYTRGACRSGVLLALCSMSVFEH